MGVSWVVHEELTANRDRTTNILGPKVVFDISERLHLDAKLVELDASFWFSTMFHTMWALPVIYVC
jgi:hypothetical protein